MNNIANAPTPRAAAPEETSLGRVGLLNRGEYDSLATYKAGDFCLYGISTWLCKLDGTTGIAPVEGANWQYLAQGSADSSITLLDKATATVAQVKAAISAGKIPVCTDTTGSVIILSATDDGSNYTVQFMEAVDAAGTRTVGTYYRTVLSSPDSTVIFSGEQDNTPALFEGDLDNSVVTDTYGVSEDSPSDLPAKVTVKKMFNGVGNWIANKLVHTDAFQTVLKQYLVNNGTTTNEGFGLDARYGKNLQDQVSTLNANLNHHVDIDQLENTDVSIAANTTATTTFTINIPQGYRFVGIVRAWVSSPNVFVFNAYANSNNTILMSMRNISEGQLTGLACYVSVLYERS